MKTFATTLLGAAIAAAFLSSPSQAFERPGAPQAAKGTERALAAPSDRIIIKFREGLATPSEPRMQSMANAAAGLDVQIKQRRVMAIGGEAVKLSRKLDRVEMDVFLSRLGANPAVEYAIVDRRMRPTYTPNDPGYSSQWHFKSTLGGLNLPGAWDITRGTGIVVAVIDTGVASHTDLNKRLLPGYDFIIDLDTANDGNGRDASAADPGDWVIAGECEEGSEAENSSWHGTHVAGTVSAAIGNNHGVASVAPFAQVIPLRALGKCGGYTSDIADAIVWGSGGSVVGLPPNANPAEVINMSLGGSGSCDPATQTAINSAVSRGSVVVVAAGNSNSSVEDFSPASCNNVISVASNDMNFKRSGFSNAGTRIDVAAPGGEPGIYSTYNNGTTVPTTQNYAYLQGTSMASPHVAGVVALMQSVQVNTPARVEEILKLTARPMIGANCPGLCGAGKVDALAALNGVNGVFPPPARTILLNGIGKPIPAGGAGTEYTYQMSTYNGLSNIRFAITGGTGNVDLYVKFGSMPTTSNYDCRSIGGTNEEVCNIPVGQVGTYYVLVRTVDAHDGVARVNGTHASRTFVNRGDQAIRDNGDPLLVPVLVHGHAGNMPANLTVQVALQHTYIGDLVIDLVAPDGTVYPLQANAGGSADSLITSFTVDASSEPKIGYWNLRVQDNADFDTGHVDQWSLKF